MKNVRYFAYGILTLIFFASVLAESLAPACYATQYREFPNASPSRQFPLGTDALGRDRLSRLLYGSRVSLLLAPAAALLSTIGAAFIGGMGGYLGKGWERIVISLIDLFLSLPWLFLVLTIRAMLPLNVSPLTSVVITFSLLGLLGWAAPARVVRSGARCLRTSDFVLQARAAGCRRRRIFLVHVLPNLQPILYAQFWISVPAFILAEANLGLLGLGVAEPLPSWGNLLRELESYSAVKSNPCVLAPLALLVVVVGCLQLILWGEESGL
jgi:peptide/nickel transport system permease protein